VTPLLQHCNNTLTTGAGSVLIKVVRTAGCMGHVSVNYETHSGSAIAGRDFVASKGTLEFKHAQVRIGTQLHIR
jgi:hypothetical protein